MREWTGREAVALRMIEAKFARALGVSVRTVANWHTNPATVPRNEAQDHFKLKIPAPFQHRQDYSRALITSAREALRHGDRPAAVSQGPGGTWEVSQLGIITSIPAVLTREQDAASARPARRPALRLVQDGHAQ